MKETTKRKALEFLKLTKRQPVICKNKKIEFARTNEEDINEIGDMSNDELLETFKTYYSLINVILRFSLADLQMKHLCLMELDDRGLIPEAERIAEELKRKAK